MLKLFHRWMTINSQTQKMIFGTQRVSQYFSDQIDALVRQSVKRMKAPTLIGEVGIPFDMQNKKAFRSGNFSMQVRALDATMTALERSFVSFTLWNYTADNSNARGDQWNDEDLSLFSRDQTINDGGRALKAAVRPYARKIAGEPVGMSFDIHTAEFKFIFRHADEVDAPTELFIPEYSISAGFFCGGIRRDF